ncbi:GntR family transcriptional regulator [Pseudonocardia xinjiangensis]|uniref:GntR family transcriptional regulator n=1 Tax=Pseudonocardia xinjiangensis TaxID=75289 RepID=A0ABX1RPI1_9PSEU|nr:GntR family transcriptional regulator [Pseudonocardia xinjiangensis]NMH81265.1 GntR family transcriptional regulator [Pseudonocardia xinjiangensis]
MQAADPSPESGRDRAYRHLRETVLIDPAAQGTFLNEGVLAQAIGVSRTPVREALLLLVAEGLVEMVPKRGAYVPPLSGRQIKELMELRGLLERHAASVTLTEGTVPLAAMREALAEQERFTDAVANPATAQVFIEWDRRFHQVLVDAARNDLIARTYAGLRTRQVRVGVAAMFRTADRQRGVCDEHARIVAALESGDEAAAHTAIEDHLAITLRLFLEA